MAQGTRTRHGGITPVVVPVVLILAGILVTLYPLAATWYNSYHQASFAARYSAAVAQAPSSALAEQRNAAQRYNASLPTRQLTDPWTGQDDPASAAAWTSYRDQLNRYDVMARLRVPSIHIDLPIYHGTDDEVLAKGVGHMFGTSLPVGGPGHAVLTAHSGWSSAILFERLPELSVGAMMYLDVYGETLAYQVSSTEVVLPSELISLARDDVDRLTLITCTPRTINSHRLLVHAVRVPSAQAPAATPALRAMDWSIQPWMRPRLLIAAGGLLLLAALVWHNTRRGKRNRS